MHGTKRMKRTSSNNAAFSLLEQNNRSLRTENETLKRQIDTLASNLDALEKKLAKAEANNAAKREAREKLIKERKKAS